MLIRETKKRGTFKVTKKVLSIFLVIVLVLGVAAMTGCSNGTSTKDPGGEGGEPSGSESNHAIMGTSGIGGSWYPTASTIAGVVMKNSDSMITVQATGGGTENLRLMRQGEMNMGLCEANVMNYSYQGEQMFEGDPYTDMMFVTQLYPIVFQGAVHASSNYKTFADLVGKENSFSPGSPGSGDEYGWAEILAEFGVTKDNVDWRPLSHTERSMAFKDRNLDCVGNETAVPAGVLLEIGAQNPVRILAVDGAEQKALMDKYSWFTPWTIPAGTYNGQDEEVETVATMSMVVADKSVSEKVIYDYVMAIYNDLEPIHEVHSMTPYVSLETALLGQGDIPLHPGAEKAYKELGLL